MLNAIEKISSADLLLNDASTVTAPSCRLLLAEAILNKKMVSDSKKVSSYVDLQFNAPTSNMCERLFSVAVFCHG